MTRFRRSILSGTAVLVAAVAVVLHEMRSPALPASPPTTPSAANSKILSAKVARPETRGSLQGLPALPPPEKSPHAPGSPAAQEWTTARIAALRDLAWFDNSESLAKILAELRNPIPEIRHAALDAVRSSGNRSAIPYLARLADEARDPDEAKQISATIDFLKLPTALEQFQGDDVE